MFTGVAALLLAYYLVADTGAPIGDAVRKHDLNAHQS
jgi:hypothetical protein